MLSLDMIEHVILRGQMDHPSLEGVDEALISRLKAEFDLTGHFDPRLHFALNCGSRSCPDLRREAVDLRVEVGLRGPVALPPLPGAEPGADLPEPRSRPLHPEALVVEQRGRDPLQRGGEDAVHEENERIRILAVNADQGNTN